MGARVRDIAHLSQRIEVEDADVPGRSGTGNVEVTTVRICGQVVESTLSTNQLDFDDLVGVILLSTHVRGEQKSKFDYPNSSE